MCCFDHVVTIGDYGCPQHMERQYQYCISTTTSFLVLNTKHITKPWNIYEYLPAKSSHHPTVSGSIVRTEAVCLLRANKWKDSYAAQLSVFGQTRILPTYSGSHSSQVAASRLRLHPEQQPTHKLRDVQKMCREVAVYVCRVHQSNFVCHLTGIWFPSRSLFCSL